MKWQKNEAGEDLFSLHNEEDGARVAEFTIDRTKRVANLSITNGKTIQISSFEAMGTALGLNQLEPLPKKIHDLLFAAMHDLPEKD